MSRGLTIAAFLLACASPVCAEVMDKEMSVPDIWRSAGLAVLVALGATLLNRWLILVSFFLAVVVGPTFAWTEWYDGFAGPAILEEAGPSYGLHANAAMSLVVVAHMLGWMFASNLRRRKLTAAGRWSPVLARRSVIQTAIFMLLFASLTALAATSGFGAGRGIWLSPPILVSILCCVTAMGLAAQSLRRTEPRSER